MQYGWKCSAEVRAQLNEVRFSQWFSFEELFSNFRSFVETFLEPSVAFKVAVGGSANAAATTPVKSEISSAAKDVKNSVESPPPTLASEESLSEFFTQVASLVK